MKRVVMLGVFFLFAILLVGAARKGVAHGGDVGVRRGTSQEGVRQPENRLREGAVQM